MSNMIVASLPISIPNHHLSTSTISSSTSKSTTTHLPYPTATSSIRFSTSVSQLGSSWIGLKFANITFSKQIVTKDKRRRRCRGNVVYASLFGVGAPEALVIGVVALLVFGPKGLAEVARNLGKTLRAFQPTIRELQDVSREFKSTLEREIGLDDIANPVHNNYTSIPRTPTSAPTPPSSSDTLQTPVKFTDESPSSSKAYTSEEYLKVTDEQLKAAAAAAWQQEQEQIISQIPQSESKVQESASTVPPLSPTKLEGDTSS